MTHMHVPQRKNPDESFQHLNIQETMTNVFIWMRRVCSHLAGWGLSHHGLIGRRQVSRVQRPWTVDRNPVDGTEGRMGEVQMKASVRGITAEFK